MLTVIILILSIPIGITGLVFLVLGLTYNDRQKITGGGVAIAIALIFFFFSIFQFFEAYFRFLGKIMEKSYKENYERSYNYDENYVSEADFCDTIYDETNSIYLLNGLEEIQTYEGSDVLAIYLPAGFEQCTPESITLSNEMQVNILMTETCAKMHPDKLEVYDENDLLTNNSVFVQTEPQEDGRLEVQYILRKKYDKDESYYILLKYE